MSRSALCLFMTTLFLKNGMTLGKHQVRRFTQIDVCYETSKSLEMVEQCPTNATIFQERSAKKTCDLYPSCSGIPLVYHCVSYKKGLAEVCAPRDQITGFCCALYDEGVGRVVEDYTRPCSNCSFRYPSDNIVKYPQCIAPPKTTFSDNDTKESAPCLNGRKRGKRHAECSGVLNENAGDWKESDSSIDAYVYTIAPPVIFIVCLTIVVTYCKGKKKLDTPQLLFQAVENPDDNEHAEEKLLKKSPVHGVKTTCLLINKE